MLTENGELCGPCFARYQNDQDERARVASNRSQGLARRAALVARLHAILWVTVFILSAEAMDTPAVVGGGMLVALLALWWGLATGQRWAYICALALDGAGTVTLLVLGATFFKHERRWVPVFVAPFTLALGYVVWRLRSAFPRKVEAGSGLRGR
jgi:hypothetical protein